jgi:type I restriction enzyme M protein
MLTGEIRSQVDRIWDAFWSGGISNSLEVIEQLTYLLFIKRLDELHTLEEAKANRLGQPIERAIFPEGTSPFPNIEGQQKFSYEELRWSRFKNFEPKRMYDVIANGAFPFMKSLGNGESAYATHMKEARFTLPPEKAGLLVKVVDIISNIPMDDRDTKGDVYEYMLSKLSEAGQNGQFRTPRHIIKMMVAMRAPTPQDTICDSRI